MTMNPFPGLRPFEADEDHLFFGRDDQSDEMLTRLRCNRFVAVVGTSGSGKSSLIRAGLLPSLHGGFMVNAGSRWRVAIFRPGNDPIRNLALALNKRGVLQNDGADLKTNNLTVEATLRRGTFGLIETVRQARMPEQENLLIVVDQFEELFRFKTSKKTEASEDAAAFVKLLIEAARQSELPIYVVITMRSDFLGDCARFRELPETINEGLYLIPLMTRAQLREAITGPVAVAAAEMSPNLINRLLNDVGEDPTRLPILQHALMRTWDYWAENHEDGAPIRLRHYEEVGGMAEALSRHADEAYNELSKDQQEIAERIFRALTEKEADNREVRRPTKVAEICAITGASQAEVIAIIENFRRPGRSFLMPPADVPLTADTLIDISHESLIGGWKRLGDWVDAEALSAGIYRRIADTAVLFEKGKAALWRDPDLQVALGWREKAQPNKAWGQHYHQGFDGAITFLEKSEEARDASLAERERQRRQALRRTRIFAMVLGVLLFIASGLGVWARIQTKRANSLAETARAEQHKALLAKAEADRARDDAEKAKAEADEQRRDALESKRIAVEEQGKAEAARRKAVASAKKALAAAREADKQRGIAEARNKLFLAAVRDAEEQNLNDMSTISFLTNQLIALSSPQEAIKWRTVRGSALTGKRWHSEAADEYTKTLEVSPDLTDARMSRGYMYMLTDRVPDSINDFDRIIAEDPKSSLGYLNRGLSQGILGGYAEASSSVSKAIETFMPGSYGGLSESQVSPTITRATGYRRVAADENSFQTALYYELANVEAFRGGDDFVKRLQAAQQRPPSDSAFLSAINWAWLHMDKRPKDYGGWVSQGAMWQALGPKYCGEAAYAYAQFQKNYKEQPDPRYGSLANFVKRHPANCLPAEPLPGEDVQELSLKAEVALDHGQNQDAEELLTKAIDQERTALAQEQKATAQHKKAIGQEPNNVGALNQTALSNLLLKRADVLNKSSKFAESGADADEVIRLVGNHPEALVFRALASTDDEVVEKNLRQVLADHRYNYDALFWLSKSVQVKRPGEAIDLLDRAIKLRPYNDSLYLRKSQLQDGQGLYSRALQTIESAIVINPYVIEYYDQRASIERHLSKAPAHIARNLVEGYTEVADLMFKRGDAGAALDTYVRSLKLLAGVANSQGSAEMQCDMALTIHKTARLLEQQGASRGKVIEHLRFMFGDVKGLEGVLTDEVRFLSSTP